MVDLDVLLLYFYDFISLSPPKSTFFCFPDDFAHAVTDLILLLIIGVLVEVGIVFDMSKFLFSLLCVLSVSL